MENKEVAALCNAVAGHLINLYYINVKQGLLTMDGVRNLLLASTKPQDDADELTMAMRDHLANLMLDSLQNR
ncbi:MAG: hypothetical protein GC201_02220 [Alphaproteobacteria bacterium]|nr:hypothetical protein [Alphaproteobacteria bacterium]